MHNAIDRLEQDVHAALASAAKVPTAFLNVETPKHGITADLSFPAFRYAAEMGVAPADLAREITNAIQPDPGSFIGSVVAVGPYVNFTIAMDRYVGAVLQEIEQLGPRYGHDDRNAGKTVVVDYSATNIARRMHVGHIRSTIIGHAIVNVLAALGYNVVGDNHIGDWGKSFGILLTAVHHEGYPPGEGEQLLAALEDLYARYSARAEQEETVDAEARRWSLRLEQGDQDARRIWQAIVDLTLGINQASYDRLGIQFDHVYGESFYEPMLQDVIDDALRQGIAYRDESGAVVVDLGDGLPSFLLQRSDGGTLYHTRDVATIRFRVREFAPDQIIYVVGAPQELYFRQLFALVRALGYAEGVRLVHVPFGTVFDQQGQALSTRRGNMVYLETLLDEAHRRARAIIDAANPEWSSTEQDQVAEAVGIGALIYNDLHQDPRRNITLDWDCMLALEGNSAPYVQYMYARCRSILRRAATASPAGNGGDASLLIHPSEQALVKQLARLPVAVRHAGQEYAPQHVADWCYETARALAAFYRDCHVLSAESDTLRSARLRLVAATAQALRNGLALLGIAAPERL